jgi:hypothetical protein
VAVVAVAVVAAVAVLAARLRPRDARSPGERAEAESGWGGFESASTFEKQAKALGTH